LIHPIFWEVLLYGEFDCENSLLNCIPHCKSNKSDLKIIRSRTFNHYCTSCYIFVYCAYDSLYRQVMWCVQTRPLSLFYCVWTLCIINIAFIESGFHFCLVFGSY
jgi:hypothetical protein